MVHNDHLGTPQIITDGTQAVVWEVTSQTPFGIVEINEDPDGDGIALEFNVRFPGQYFDEELGLIITTSGIMIRVWGGIFKVIRLGWLGGLILMGMLCKIHFLTLIFMGLIQLLG